MMKTIHCNQAVSSLTRAGVAGSLCWMRLPPQYAEFFKAEATALRSGADVYLFGSRRDESRKGGDLDILVLSNPKLNWEEASHIRRRFWRQFGFQKLDLVCFSLEDRSVFKELVLLDAIRL
jgi:predicted nucleotidyltransferase